MASVLSMFWWLYQQAIQVSTTAPEARRARYRSESPGKISLRGPFVPRDTICPALAQSIFQQLIPGTISQSKLDDAWRLFRFWRNRRVRANKNSSLISPDQRSSAFCFGDANGGSKSKRLCLSPEPVHATPVFMKNTARRSFLGLLPGN